MKEAEFCYWLQGSIELSTPNSFNNNQTMLIKKHLEMVLYHEKNITLPFINWLNGFYELMSPSVINEEQTILLKKKLSETFLHYIDASYPENEKLKLNEIHNGIENIERKIEILC